MQLQTAQITDQNFLEQKHAKSLKELENRQLLEKGIKKSEHTEQVDMVIHNQDKDLINLDSPEEFKKKLISKISLMKKKQSAEISDMERQQFLEKQTLIYNNQEEQRNMLYVQNQKRKDLFKKFSQVTKNFSLHSSTSQQLVSSPDSTDYGSNDYLFNMFKNVSPITQNDLLHDSTSQQLSSNFNNHGSNNFLTTSLSNSSGLMQQPRQSQQKSMYHANQQYYGPNFSRQFSNGQERHLDKISSGRLRKYGSQQSHSVGRGQYIPSYGSVYNRQFVNQRNQSYGVQFSSDNKACNCSGYKSAFHSGTNHISSVGKI